ncbi:MAG: CPBP family intramembrane glutamic endopeptidase [Candidatus Bathyarchaeia archaeon]
MAVTLLLYLSTFNLILILLFPIILFTSGAVLQYRASKVKDVNEKRVSFKSGKNIGYYVVLGVAALFIIGWGISIYDLYPFLATVTLSSTNLALYGVLIAISEEEFFRGLWTNLLMKNTKSLWFAIIGSAAVFTVFHFAIYKSAPSSIYYVMGAGVLLSYFGLESGRLSVSMTIHILNNLIVQAMSP